MCLSLYHLFRHIKIGSGFYVRYTLELGWICWLCLWFLSFMEWKPYESLQFLCGETQEAEENTCKRYLIQGLMWFCGLGGSEEQLVTQAEALTSIVEFPFWKAICDINVSFLLSVAVFCWAYFAWTEIKCAGSKWGDLFHITLVSAIINWRQHSTPLCSTLSALHCPLL